MKKSSKTRKRGDNCNYSVSKHVISRGVLILSLIAMNTLSFGKVAFAQPTVGTTVKTKAKAMAGVSLTISNILYDTTHENVESTNKEVVGDNNNSSTDSSTVVSDVQNQEQQNANEALNPPAQNDTSSTNSSEQVSNTNNVDDGFTQMDMERANASIPEGDKLNSFNGVFHDKWGHKETYYNLDMSGIVARMRRRGFSEKDYPYWIRDDGVKMLGPYVMAAAYLKLYPRGSIVETSLGTAIVCDTGGFIYLNQTQYDIAVTW